MSNLQFQNDLERLLAVMPRKVVENLSSDRLDDVIEIVLDIGRVPEVRHAGGKIEKLNCDFVNDEDISFVTSHLQEFTHDNRSGKTKELLILALVQAVVMKNAWMQ